MYSSEVICNATKNSPMLKEITPNIVSLCFDSVFSLSRVTDSSRLAIETKVIPVSLHQPYMPDIKDTWENENILFMEPNELNPIVMT